MPWKLLAGLILWRLFNAREGCVRGNQRGVFRVRGCLDYPFTLWQITFNWPFVFLDLKATVDSSDGVLLWRCLSAKNTPMNVMSLGVQSSEQALNQDRLGWLGHVLRMLIKQLLLCILWKGYWIRNQRTGLCRSPYAIGLRFMRSPTPKRWWWYSSIPHSVVLLHLKCSFLGIVPWLIISWSVFHCFMFSFFPFEWMVVWDSSQNQNTLVQV